MLLHTHTDSSVQDFRRRLNLVGRKSLSSVVLTLSLACELKTVDKHTTGGTMTVGLTRLSVFALNIKKHSLGQQEHDLH